MFFNEYPYINLQDVNLDWILKQIKELSTNLQDFVKINTIKYADPIIWNITKQYETNTVVIDGNTGTAYLSTQPVPTGVSLTNTDYWTPIFTLSLMSANQNITFRDDESNVVATFESNTGDWILWNFNLYRVTRDISLNTAYVVGYNLERYSVELFVSDYIDHLTEVIGELDDLNTSDKTSIVNAINSVLADLDDRFIKPFNTVSDMVSSDLAVGEYVQTAGYYSVGDFGACLYKIVSTSTDFTVALDNGLYALPIINDVYPEIFGAHCDGVNDDRPAFEKAISYIYSLNPVRLNMNTFYRGFGGGTLKLHAKKYYILTKMSCCDWSHLTIEGESSASTEIYVNGIFCDCDYSTKTLAERVDPWQLTIDNITFIQTDYNDRKMIQIDRPYGLRINNCRFINDRGGSTIDGTAIYLSTTVDVIINNCTFQGFNYGVRIGVYPYTYPSGFNEIIVQNTTVLIKDSVFFTNDIAIAGTFLGVANFIQNLICENVIIESNGTGINISGSATSNASQLICKDCYFELNSVYAINLANCALIFDDTNILNRTDDPDYKNQIIMFERRADTNGWPLKDDITVPRNTDIIWPAYNPYWMFSFPCKFDRPNLSYDSYSHIYKYDNLDASILTNIVDTSKYTKVFVEIIGPSTYWSAKGNLSVTPNTYTVVNADSNVTVRSDGALIVSEQSTFIIHCIS